MKAVDNWMLVSQISEKSFEKGALSREFKRYRYGSANWRLVETEYEKVSIELLDLIREFHKNFPLTCAEVEVE